MSSEQFIEIQKCIKEFPKSKILKSYGNNYGRYKMWQINNSLRGSLEHMMRDFIKHQCEEDWHRKSKAKT